MHHQLHRQLDSSSSSNLLTIQWLEYDHSLNKPLINKAHLLINKARPLIIKARPLIIKARPLIIKAILAILL